FIDSGIRAAFAETPIWIAGEIPLSHNISVFVSMNVTGGTAFFMSATTHVSIGLEFAMSLLTYKPGFKLLTKFSM
ncbi:MAG TPA: hypothetical protein PK074_06735, partial [Spirochaetales bacterium]|nr:hypothetical protein [Spirochaetales bacterium]